MNVEEISSLNKSAGDIFSFMTSLLNYMKALSQLRGIEAKFSSAVQSPLQNAVDDKLTPSKTAVDQYIIEALNLSKSTSHSPARAIIGSKTKKLIDIKERRLKHNMDKARRQQKSLDRIGVYSSNSKPSLDRSGSRLETLKKDLYENQEADAQLDKKLADEVLAILNTKMNSMYNFSHKY